MKVYQLSLRCGVKISENRLFADLLEDLELDAEVGGLRNPIDGAPVRADPWLFFCRILTWFTVAFRPYLRWDWSASPRLRYDPRSILGIG